MRQSIRIATCIARIVSGAAFAAAVTIIPTCTAAQVQFVNDKDELPAADKGLDLAVPDSPGFAVLGLNPDTVSRPTTPRELAASLLNGVDANGNFQSGFALDASPYMLIAGDDLTIGVYRKDAVARTLARTQLSLATSKGANDDDDAIRAGLGVRTVLWDRGDPRLDDELWRCFDEVLKARPRITDQKYADRTKELVDGMTEDDADPTARRRARKVASEMVEQEFDRDLNAFVEVSRAKAQECRESREKALWNASGFELGAAPTGIQKTGDKHSFEFGGAALWASLAYGFEGAPALQDSSQALFQLRYKIDEQVPIEDGNGAYFDQDSLIAGVRIRLGRPKWNISVEADYLREDPEGASVDQSYRLSATTDLKITDSIWLNLGIGTTGAQRDDDHLFVLAAVKWGSRTLNAGAVIDALRGPTGG